MRVLHLAPLWFPVSRDSLGGIETFLAGLIEELDGLGCRNTLIATGDSRTVGELVPVVAENVCARMTSGRALEYDYYEQAQLLLALERAPEFDLVHSHIGPRAFVLSGQSWPRVLHTWHTQVYRDLQWFAGRYPGIHFSAVSEFQARKLWAQGAVHCAVIHNGVDVGAFPFQPGAGHELVFVGRLDRSKGADLAVEIAHELDWPLTLAGPITDPGWFATAVEPHLDEQIRYVGVVDHRTKVALFGAAGAALVPSRVEEACPLVAIEAQVCGAPVVALANGGLPELIEHGVTGYVAANERDLAACVRRAISLDRATIRARAVDRFDLAAAAARYLKLYLDIVRA
jgi:glycosyltransferase involved in cell wall biosynthesis